jgi:queuine tRNA-ribosyltransferase
MPVGTNATVKALDPDDLARSAPRSSWPTPTTSTCAPATSGSPALGGLHKFMAWDRPILTDSGGFQVVSLGELRKIDDDGVTFQSHLDGSYHRFTPELSIEVQEALGADIAVAFDQPVPPASSSREAVAEATARTNRWAERSLAAHTRPTRPLRHHPGRPGSGASGRVHAHHRRPAVRRHLHRRPGRRRDAGPARGHAGRGRRLLEDDPRPRYLMGLGSPADLLEAVHRGIDMFDSVLPARVARNGQLWVPGGRLNMRNAQFVDDPRPVQEGCRCLLCRNFSRAYLAHLFRAEELLAYRLATCHNLTFTLDFMAEIRSALRSGTFAARLPELRAHAHPSRSRALAVQSE